MNTLLRKLTLSALAGVALASSCTTLAADPPLLIFNRARFFPAPGKEQAMLGGKFSGSNV